MRRSRLAQARRRCGVRAGLAAALLAGLTLTVGVRVADALSEWWTPPNVGCPTFDSKEACETFCAANPKVCGGSTNCTWKTGPKRPMC